MYLYSLKNMPTSHDGNSHDQANKHEFSDLFKELMQMNLALDYSKNSFI